MTTTDIITSSDIYWITRCDSIFVAFFTLTIITGILCLISGIAICASYDYPDDNPKLRAKAFQALKKASTACIVFLLASVATPSTKEMCAIKIIPKIANNENVQGLGEDMVNTARDWLKELNPSKILQEEK